mmetsp:Transcript_22238/g.73176  ORF Transcript_22238/g.73176 Transcript_22238/m.73176 type:complete len:232 (-) Transcript_22238:1617-2312(-)
MRLQELRDRSLRLLVLTDMHSRRPDVIDQRFCPDLLLLLAPLSPNFGGVRYVHSRIEVQHVLAFPCSHQHHVLVDQPGQPHTHLPAVVARRLPEPLLHFEAGPPASLRCCVHERQGPSALAGRELYYSCWRNVRRVFLLLHHLLQCLFISLLSFSFCSLFLLLRLGLLLVYIVGVVSRAHKRLCVPNFLIVDTLADPWRAGDTTKDRVQVRSEEVEEDGRVKSLLAMSAQG